MRVERQICARCGARYRIVNELTRCVECGGLTLRLEVTEEDPAVPRRAARHVRLFVETESEVDGGQLGLDLSGLSGLEDDQGDCDDAL